jgi:hypothetical protein
LALLEGLSEDGGCFLTQNDEVRKAYKLRNNCFETTEVNFLIIHTNNY